VRVDFQRTARPGKQFHALVFDMAKRKLEHTAGPLAAPSLQSARGAGAALA